ncbi:hypothetical protein ACQRAR_09010 [Anaerovoracaceae bacterium SGI.174]
MMKRLIILGADGYGRTVADIAHQLGYTTIVLDDVDPTRPLSSFQSYFVENTSFIPHSVTMPSGWSGLTG